MATKRKYRTDAVKVVRFVLPDGEEIVGVANSWARARKSVKEHYDVSGAVVIQTTAEMKVLLEGGEA